MQAHQHPQESYSIPGVHALTSPSLAGFELILALLIMILYTCTIIVDCLINQL